MQCYHEKSTCKILVAANENSDIMKLKSMVHEMPLIRFFQEVSEEQNPFKLGVTKDPLGDRQIRHWQELNKLSDMANQSEEVTWSEYSFFVVPCISGVRSLHAEQRILHYLRGEAEDKSLMLQPQFLGGGIKRPCFACAHACFAPGDRANVHPGLLWDRQSATCKLEQSAVKDIVGAMKDQPIVYRTQTRMIGVATEYVDSESEDEEEFYPRLLGKL